MSYKICVSKDMEERTFEFLSELYKKFINVKGFIKESTPLDNYLGDKFFKRLLSANVWLKEYEEKIIKIEKIFPSKGKNEFGAFPLSMGSKLYADKNDDKTKKILLLYEEIRKVCQQYPDVEHTIRLFDYEGISDIFSEYVEYDNAKFEKYIDEKINNKVLILTGTRVKKLHKLKTWIISMFGLDELSLTKYNEKNLLSNMKVKCLYFEKIERFLKQSNESELIYEFRQGMFKDFKMLNIFKSIEREIDIDRKLIDDSDSNGSILLEVWDMLEKNFTQELGFYNPNVLKNELIVEKELSTTNKTMILFTKVKNLSMNYNVNLLFNNNDYDIGDKLNITHSVIHKKLSNIEIKFYSDLNEENQDKVIAVIEEMYHEMYINLPTLMLNKNVSIYWDSKKEEILNLYRNFELDEKLEDKNSERAKKYKI